MRAFRFESLILPPEAGQEGKEGVSENDQVIVSRRLARAASTGLCVTTTMAVPSAWTRSKRSATCPLSRGSARASQLATMDPRVGQSPCMLSAGLSITQA